VPTARKWTGIHKELPGVDPLSAGPDVCPDNKDNSSTEPTLAETCDHSRVVQGPELSKSIPPIEVCIFTPEGKEAPSEGISVPQRRPIVDWGQWVPRRDRTGSAACAVVTAALHLLIVAPLLPGSAHQHRVSHAMGSASSTDVEPTLQASIIEELPLALVPPPPTTAVTLHVPELPQLVPPQDLLESLAEKKPSNPNIDAAGSSALAGRYLGQIDARIERAWLKPRTPLDSGAFRCEVRVEQDTAGNVLEIELEQCGNDGRWQQSLVRAIQSASPLPAPPVPGVFRKSLHLSFTGHPWSAQGSAQGYEPLTARDPGLL
jgi:hypothetical protein